MITNEVQYRTTKAHLAKFEDAAASLRNKLAAKPKDRLTRLELDAVTSQADDLSAEIAEYDKLRSGTVSTFEADSLADLAILLVKARIARGWTQRDLAKALNIAEQQVQRYEATGYRSASLARICDVAAALAITVNERVILNGPTAA